MQKKLMALGLTTILGEAQHNALAVAIKLLEETPSWEKIDVQEAYHTQLNAGLRDAVAWAVEYSACHEFNDVNVMYRDGLISNAEFLKALIFAMLE